jgi:outer membrane biosynthesis protein TonB
MKPFRRVIPAIVAALAIASLPAQADRQAAPCSTSEPIVYPMSADLRPRIIHREKAVYTCKAKEEKIEGRVILQVVFNKNGRVTDIIPIKELPHGLTEQAIGTAYLIKFTPAMKDGKPVSVRGSLEYVFDLY